MSISRLIAVGILSGLTFLQLSRQSDQSAAFGQPPEKPKVQNPVLDFLTKPPGPPPKYQGPVVDFFNPKSSVTLPPPKRFFFPEELELLGSGMSGLGLRGKLALRQKEAKEAEEQKLPPQPMYTGPDIDFFNSIRGSK